MIPIKTEVFFSRVFELEKTFQTLAEVNQGGGMRKRILTLVILTTCAIAALVQAAASTVQLVSAIDASGPIPAGASGNSTGGELNADGTVLAFVSEADDLVTNNHNGLVLDVYVRNLINSTTTLVSANASGTSGGNGHSVAPGLSSDGNLIVFQSNASDLVPGDTNDVSDIFLRNLKSGGMRLVSVSNSGNNPGNGASSNPAITPEGRYVLFESAANNLVLNDTNSASDVFVHDLQTGVTTLVSVNTDGTASAVPPFGVDPNVPTDVSTDPTISADGRFVAFQSVATNLVGGVNFRPGIIQIYLRDLVAKTNILVSRSFTGAAGNGDSARPLISADGKYIVFASSATNLTAASASSSSIGLYLYTVESGTTLKIPLPHSSNIFDFPVITSLSPDGRFLGYSSDEQAYVWDRQGATNLLVSVNLDGQPGSGFSDYPLISDDGRRVVFSSAAPDLVTITNHGNFQLYVRDLSVGSTTLLTINRQGTGGGASDALFPIINGDASVIAFQSDDTDLVEGDFNNASDVFVRVRAEERVQLASRRAEGQLPATWPGFSSLQGQSVSADGRFALVISLVNNVTEEGTQNALQLRLRDLQLQTNRLISVNLSGLPSPGPVGEASLTPDGRFVVFSSTATDLVTVATTGVEQVYVRDLEKGKTLLVSINAKGTGGGDARSSSPVISDDGRYVAFYSEARDLTTSTTIRRGIYLRDLTEQTTRVVAANVGGTPTISSDGRFVGVAGSPSNFIVFDQQGLATWRTNYSTVAEGPFIDRHAHYVLYETRTIPGSAIRLVKLGDASGQNVWPAEVVAPGILSTARSSPRFSAAGNFVVFTSDVALDPADTNSVADVYVVNLASRAVVLASVQASGTSSGNGPSDSPSISADGRFIAFKSFATDLEAKTTNVGPNIFVRDMLLGQTYLASLNTTGAGGGNGRSFNPVISADGRTVFFVSSSSDLVAGDFNNTEDVFAFAVPQTPLSASPDSDNDGLNDIWERYYFGDLTQDGKGDFDHDEMSNLGEFTAGADPTDSDSALQVRAVRSLSDGSITIHWNAVAGHRFRAEYKNDLRTDVWMDVPGDVVADSSGAATKVDVVAGAERQRFYRIVLLP